MKNTEEIANYIRETLMEGLSKQFIGRRSTAQVKQELSLATQRLLALNEAALFGGEVTWIGTLWQKMTFKEKTLWLLANVFIKSIGQKERDRVDIVNRDRLELWVEELKLARSKDTYWDEDVEDEDYVSRPILEEYPNWANRSPKSIIKIECLIKPRLGIDFITMEFKGLDSQIRDEK